MWTDSIKKEKTDFLVSLLTTAEVEVDCSTEDGNTPLHLAVKVCCFVVVYTPEEGDVKIFWLWRHSLSQSMHQHVEHAL